MMGTFEVISLLLSFGLFVIAVLHFEIIKIPEGCIQKPACSGDVPLLFLNHKPFALTHIFTSV
ncbi:putative holin-like toxin [Peribacillus glennii]|nr:putative holin-like toxin [Peribacillus glennii]